MVRIPAGPDGTALHALLGMIDRFYRTVDQCVYLFRVASGHWKVGIARDPEQRRRGLQTGSPEAIEFHGATITAPEGIDPRALERRVHEEMAVLRVSGEWFKATEAEVMDAWSRAHDAMFREYHGRQTESIIASGALAFGA